ncbi:MAG: hypothetical protein FWF00_04235 [Endomicrobia bacterium]|nr:hypothetical protein [Endomicrobiia bacterium]MCL2506878.1 hypothetical protein [Endomicrobiia bacterium]
MKKIVLFVFLFLLVSSASYAQAIPVSSFTYLNELIAEPVASMEIELEDSITVDEAFNEQGVTDLTIFGNNFFLNGNGFGPFISSGPGQSITFSSITLDGFRNNATGSYAYGGALYAGDIANISYTAFTNNTAVDDNFDGMAYGGAVYIDVDGNANIYDTVFTSNTVAADSFEARAYGGAIYNAGTTTVTNSYFAFNNALARGPGGQSYGGAIYNEEGAFLYIVADGTNTVFEGNTAGGQQNAIFNSSGSFVYLNAASGDEIIFNDTITGNRDINARGEIHINSATASLPVDGTIVLNNAFSYNDIYLYAGTLRIGIYDGVKESTDSAGYIINPSNGSIGSWDNDGRINLFLYDGSTFDMSNGRPSDTVYLSTLTVDSGTAFVKIDVDLANNMRCDIIDASYVAETSGVLDFSGMRIISNFITGVTGDVKVLENEPSVDLLSGTPDFYTNFENAVYFVTRASSQSFTVMLSSYTEDILQYNMALTGNRFVYSTSSYVIPAFYYAPGLYNSEVAEGILTIYGGVDADSNTIVISGADFTRLFTINNELTDLKFIDLTLTNAVSEYGSIVLNSSGNLIIENSVLKNSIAKSTDAAFVAGGAILNSNYTYVEDSLFDSNLAEGDSAFGGAIYNDAGAVLTVYNSTFTRNTASGSGAKGGAIYNLGIVNLVADSGDVLFELNKAENVYNAIHNAAGSILNLNAGSGKIIFNDSITSENGGGSVININATVLDDSSVLPGVAHNGTIIFNTDMRGFLDTVNFYNGVIKFTDKTRFFNTAEFNMYSGATLDLLNGRIDTISISSFNLPDSGTAFVYLDVDLRKAQADNFKGTVLVDNTGTLTIKELNLLNDVRVLAEIISIEIADNTELMNSIVLDDSQKKVMGNIFEYYVNYNNGFLNFAYSHDYNPSVFIAPVTMLVGGYLGQLNSYVHGFQSLDNVLFGSERKGLWVRPYGYSEDVSVTSRLTVSNDAYGAYFGYDTPVEDIGYYDMSGNVSLYGSYNASTQKYTGAEINQDGGIFGVTGTLYRDRFFAALTANLGIISQHGTGPWGKDNFMMYTKGIAIKAGYEINLHEYEMFKVLPMLNLSYSSIDMAPYKHEERNVEVTTDGLSPFHIEPAVRFTAELQEGLQTYANMSYVWSLSESGNFRANDIDLPGLSVKPYFQYGLGVYKRVNENISTSAEIYGRAAGRSGVGGHLNVRYSFGR